MSPSEKHWPRNAGYMTKPWQATLRTSTGSLQESYRKFCYYRAHKLLVNQRSMKVRPLAGSRTYWENKSPLLSASHNNLCPAVQPAAFTECRGNQRWISTSCMSSEDLALFRAQRGRLPGQLWCTPGFVCSLSLDPSGWKTPATAQNLGQMKQRITAWPQTSNKGSQG